MQSQQKAASQGKPTYIISPEESTRISVLRVWLALMVPLNHIYSETIKMGGDNLATMVFPDWFEKFQFILIGLVTRVVPVAFALVSAVLLYRKPFSWGKNVVRKFKSLMVPLILLTTFWIALYAIGPHIPGLRSLFSSYNSRVADWTPLQWFTAYFGWTKIHQLPTLLYALWFMRDLMLMNIIAPAIKWVIDRIPRLFLCVLAAMLVWKTDNDFYFHTVHQVFIFFCLGYYVVKYDLHFSDLDRIPGFLIVILYALSLAGSFLARDYFYEISAVRGIPNLMGILFFCRFLTKIPEGKWQRRILWLSQYNVAIYLFHERMLTFVKKLMMHILPPCFVTSLVIFYLVPAAIIAICISIAWFLRRYQPRFYAVITGSH